MMLRSLFIGTALAAGLLSGTAIAEPLRLKPEAVIDGDRIRLGDLIEGLGKGSEIAVFRAPAPGARGTIRVDRVLAAAREMGIDGIEASGFRSIAISRPGRAISRADMQELIGKAITARGASGDLDVILDDHLMTRTVDISRTEALKIVKLTRDSASGRFEARIALAGANASDSWIVTGSIVETRDVAVPVSDLDRGDALQARDLTIVKRPVGHIGSDVITSMSDLVGMIPRRALKAGEAVRQSDLAKPILVEKNQLVSVVYASQGLMLSMRGRAQANGSMGDTVRIQNPQSKRIVEGTVSGAAQVTITTFNPRPATLADATTTLNRKTAR